MQREILFRGRREDNGEWVIGSLVMDNTTRPPSYWIVPEPECGISMCLDEDMGNMLIPVSAETVGQNTGMTDRHDTKIYEGDTLKINYGIPPTNDTLEVVWMASGWWMENEDPERLSGYLQTELLDDIEVVTERQHDNRRTEDAHTHARRVKRRNCRP